jgi:phage-related tail fiber protein
MAEAVTTYDFRKRLARHFYNGQPLPQASQMAFGDGGHNTDDTPKNPDPNQDNLQNELLRKDLASIYQEDDFSTTGSGRIAKSELNGASISEAGLLDSDGNLLGFKNFAPKIKESDEEYEINIKLKF